MGLGFADRLNSNNGDLPSDAKALRWRQIAGGAETPAPRYLSISAQDIVAVDPDFLPVTDPPMAWLPDIVSMSHVISGTVDVVRPIVNGNADRPWITTTIVRRRTVRWPISRVPCVIAVASSENNCDGD